MVLGRGCREEEGRVRNFKGKKRNFKGE